MLITAVFPYRAVAINTPSYQEGTLIDESSDELEEELFDNRSPIQRFISPYNAPADIPHNVSEFSHASGNWLGGRDFLDAHGIQFSTTYTSDLAGNPIGGKIPGGFTYCDNFTFGCLVETEKLFGWHGGYFMISTLQRDGTSLSRRNIGNQFTVQQIAGEDAFRWYELSYQQDFLRDRLSLKFGRLGALDDFDASTIYWLYMNNAINGNIQALPVDGKMSVYPIPSWGARLKYHFTPTTNMRLGIYQQTTPSINNLTWNFYPSDGIILMAQCAWDPKFMNTSSFPWSISQSDAPLTSQKKSSLSSTTKKKEKKSMAETVLQKKFPGHYYMGGYYSTWEYRQFNNTSYVPNAYGFYWHADQTLYRPNPITDAGLVLWSVCSFSPQQNISLLPFQVNAGAVYTGLIPGRVNDNSIFGVAYGKMSSVFASEQEDLGNSYRTYELMYELAYRINITQFFYVQPDLQWVIHPRGNESIPNALVVGSQIGVIF